MANTPNPNSPLKTGVRKSPKNPALSIVKRAAKSRAAKPKTYGVISKALPADFLLFVVVVFDFDPSEGDEFLLPAIYNTLKINIYIRKVR